jgi:hypothetical protein
MTTGGGCGEFGSIGGFGGKGGCGGFGPPPPPLVPGPAHNASEPPESQPPGPPTGGGVRHKDISEVQILGGPVGGSGFDGTQSPEFSSQYLSGGGPGNVVHLLLSEPSPMQISGGGAGVHVTPVFVQVPDVVSTTLEIFAVLEVSPVPFGAVGVKVHLQRLPSESDSQR